MKSLARMQADKVVLSSFLFSILHFSLLLYPGLLRADGHSQKMASNISRLSSVTIKQINLSSSVLQDEIDKLLTPFENKEVAVEQLLALKDEINQLFALKGYINSGVQIPDQKIEGGKLEFKLIEGRISNLNITSKLSNSYIKKRLKLNSPFNLNELQSSLKLLEQNPFVQRIDANISPGMQLGSADFSLSVETKPRYSLSLNVANDRSPSVGSENAQLSFKSNNLTGWGDQLSLSSSITEGLESQNIHVTMPFNRFDHSISLFYASSDSSVIEEPFASIDVESETKSFGLSVDFPIFKTLKKTIALHLNVEMLKNQTSLLGQAFSFSEGAINGESRVNPVRAAISYASQSSNKSFAGRFSVSHGSHHFDATQNDDQADANFTSYLLQLQYSRQITDRFHITARVLSQYASDPLLSIEKFSLGGLNSVRGYRQNQIVRDKANLVSIEGRYRLKTNHHIEVIGFFDWGRGENHGDALIQGKKDISSVGLGINYISAWGLSLELYLAHAFKDVPVDKRDLQDDGVHFQVRYEYVF